MIREQILRQTRQEVPHSVAVLVERWEESSKITRIAATIYVERDGQKAIVIGAGGATLKKSARWPDWKSKRCWVARSFLNCLSKCERIGAKIPNFSMPLTGAPCGGENWSRTKVLFPNATPIYCSLVGSGLDARCSLKRTRRLTDDVIVDQVRVKIADDSEVGGQPISRGRPQRRGGADRQGDQRQAKGKSRKNRQESEGRHRRGQQAGDQSQLSLANVTSPRESA